MNNSQSVSMVVHCLNAQSLRIITTQPMLVFVCRTHVHEYSTHTVNARYMCVTV